MSGATAISQARTATDRLDHPEAGTCTGSAGPPTIDDLIKTIKKLDGRLSTSETAAVKILAEKGQTLCDLKALAGREWGKQLKKLNINARVASRLISIGNWYDEIGLNESDLISKLPQDVHKLEWLAKLTPGQLQPLVKDLDCRQTPRATLIATVKELLGQIKPEQVRDGLTRIEKAIMTLDRYVDGLSPTSLDGETSERPCRFRSERAQLFRSTRASFPTSILLAPNALHFMLRAFGARRILSYQSSRGTPWPK